MKKKPWLNNQQSENNEEKANKQIKGYRQQKYWVKQSNKRNNN